MAKHTATCGQRNMLEHASRGSIASFPPLKQHQVHLNQLSVRFAQAPHPGTHILPHIKSPVLGESTRTPLPLIPFGTNPPSCICTTLKLSYGSSNSEFPDRSPGSNQLLENILRPKVMPPGKAARSRSPHNTQDHLPWCTKCFNKWIGPSTHPPSSQGQCVQWVSNTFWTKTAL